MFNLNNASVHPKQDNSMHMYRNCTLNVGWKSLHASQVAHQTGAHPSFCSMERLGVFLLSPGWDASP